MSVVMIPARFKNPYMLVDNIAEFTTKLKEGDYLLACHHVDSKANLAQLARVHASIRVIAKELGYTFGEFKRITKAETGFLMEGPSEEVIEFSFGTADKDQLDTVINFLEVTASQNGIILP
jgi:hypothetical protein